MSQHTLMSMFAGLFRKQGFQTTEYEALEVCEFDNYAMTGMVGFDKKNKCHKVRWKMKKGYELFDVPMAPGFVSAEFKNAGDLLNFLQRRLVCKKQK